MSWQIYFDNQKCTGKDVLVGKSFYFVDYDFFRMSAPVLDGRYYHRSSDIRKWSDFKRLATIGTYRYSAVI